MINTEKLEHISKIDQLSIPLYQSSISAGFPSPAEDYIDHQISLDKNLIKNHAATFILKVEGNSMIDANIFSGDYIIIDQSIDPQPGDIVLAIVEDEFTIKRLCKENNNLVLRAESSSFKIFNNFKIENFELRGVVTYSIHSHYKKHPLKPKMLSDENPIK